MELDSPCYRQQAAHVVETQHQGQADLWTAASHKYQVPSSKQQAASSTPQAARPHLGDVLGVLNLPLLPAEQLVKVPANSSLLTQNYSFLIHDSSFLIHNSSFLQYKIHHFHSREHETLQQLLAQALGVDVAHTISKVVREHVREHVNDVIDAALLLIPLEEQAAHRRQLTVLNTHIPRF